MNYVKIGFDLSIGWILGRATMRLVCNAANSMINKAAKLVLTEDEIKNCKEQTPELYEAMKPIIRRYEKEWKVKLISEDEGDKNVKYHRSRIGFVND